MSNTPVDNTDTLAFEKDFKSLEQWFESLSGRIDSLDILKVQPKPVKDTNKEHPPAPVSIGEAMGVIISKQNINVDSFTSQKVFNTGYGGSSIQDVINNKVDITNDMLVAFCKVCNMHKNIEDLIEVNKKWLHYKDNNTDIRDLNKQALATEINKLKTEFKNNIKTLKDDYKNKTDRYASTCNDLINARSKVWSDEQHRLDKIKELDSDKMLSDIVQNIDTLDKNQIVDKVFLAKNSLVKLIEEKDARYSYEDVQKYRNKIEHLEQFRTLLYSVSASKFVIIMSLIIYIYLKK